MFFFPPLQLPQLKFWNWGLSAMAGSANVRIGHASSKAPITVPHCIAHHLWINDKKEGSAKRSSHKGAVGEKWVCALPNMITYDYLTEYMLFDSDVCSMLQKLTQSSFFFVLQFGTALLSAARRDERKDILEMVRRHIHPIIKLLWRKSRPQHSSVLAVRKVSSSIEDVTQQVKKYLFISVGSHCHLFPLFSKESYDLHQ